MKGLITIFAILTIVNSFGQVSKETITLFGQDKSKLSKNAAFRESASITCNTITSFKTRPVPAGIAWDGQNLWYSDTGYIYKITLDGQYIDSLVNPAKSNQTSGGELFFDGTYVWLSDEQTAQLYKINPTTHSTVNKFNLPSFGQVDPNGFGITWDGANIWHSQYLPPRIYKLNPSNGQILDSLITPVGILTLEWINGKLYGVNNIKSKIYTINQSSGSLEDSTDWCIPFTLGLAWDGSYLWNISGQDSIYLKDIKKKVYYGGNQKIYKLNAGQIVNKTLKSNVINQTNIYPNPANEILCIDGENVTSVEMYNLTGELVQIQPNYLEGFGVKLNISNIPKGIYFLNITYGLDSKTHKIVF